MTDFKNCINYSIFCGIDSIATGFPCFCRCDGNPGYECKNFKNRPQ